MNRKGGKVHCMQDVMGMSQESEEPPAVGYSAENVIDARTREPDRNRVTL